MLSPKPLPEPSAPGKPRCIPAPASPPGAKGHQLQLRFCTETQHTPALGSAQHRMGHELRIPNSEREITLTLPETPTLLIPTQKLAGVKATETGSNKQDP